jgi:hypothetical protein
MYILNLFEAVYKSHVLSLVKKGLECTDMYKKTSPHQYALCVIVQSNNPLFALNTL